MRETLSSLYRKKQPSGNALNREAIIIVCNAGAEAIPDARHIGGQEMMHAPALEFGKVPVYFGAGLRAMVNVVVENNVDVVSVQEALARGLEQNQFRGLLTGPYSSEFARSIVESTDKVHFAVPAACDNLANSRSA